jgi:UDP-glucose 4-epimerase
MTSNKQELALVTGGAGFIGSHLVEALVFSGKKVKVFDNLSSGTLKNLGKIKKKIEFIQGDIRDWNLLKKSCLKSSFIFHLAGMASVPQSQLDPDLCLDINGRGTLNVFKAAAEVGVKKLVYASSSAVYGDLPSPHGELLLPKPNTPYAALKLFGEHLGLFFHEQNNLKTICLRFFNVYGPRQSPNGPDAGVIPIFVQALKNGKTPVIYGDGRQTRDFIHVKDVVKAALKAAEINQKKGVEIINVATGFPVEINRLYSLLKKLYPKAPKPHYAPPRPGDPVNSMALIEKAKAKLNFKAEISLKDGLLDLFKTFKN